MAFADDLISLFVAAGMGTAGTDLLIGPRALVSDAAAATGVLTINPQPGSAPEGTHNSTDAPAYVRPSAQIVARAKTLAVAEAKAQAAYNVLYKVRNQFVNGVWYRQITIVGEPFPIGEDDNDLLRVVFNIECVKRLSAATS
jgi:hypothetical protein